MTAAAPRAIAVHRAIERVMRQDRGRLIAALIARLGDFQLAEEALQDAAVSALSHWGRSGLPDSPQGWLLRVAGRKAIDRLRSAGREGRKAADLARLIDAEAQVPTPEPIPDERLRLIFTCCHPALDRKSQVALTLRTLGGLTTAEIARAFLDAETTMGQRLSRARARIASAGIPFAVPDAPDWPEQLNAVLGVVYLIFNAGYSAAPDVAGGTGGGGGRATGLCEEAIWLGAMLDGLCPGDPEIAGLRALMLLTHARSPARRDAQGTTLPPAQQDRDLWDTDGIALGLSLLDTAMAERRPGPFQIKAAVAALHVQAGAAGPDWPQIALLYESLLRYEPTAVVRLNHAVALSEAGAAALAMPLLQQLAPELAGYQPYHAARADLLARLGQPGPARAAYLLAESMTENAADRAFLAQRRARLG